MKVIDIVLDACIAIDTMKTKLSKLFRLLSNNKSSEISSLQKIEVDDKNILEYTSRVSIELSNLCNYAEIHKKCPLNLVTEPTILPAKIVFDVLDTLKHNNFQGTIAYHTYNEPLIDPRLFKFIEYAHAACPKSEIYICTNGYYLNQILLNELVDSGVSKIAISAYSKSEYKRLSKLKSSMPLHVELMKLDDRLHLYESEDNNTKKPCYAPLNEIIIAREGCICLCCLDWKRQYTFGNLYEQTLKDIILSGELHAVYKKLIKGERFLPICKKCGWSR